MRNQSLPLQLNVSRKHIAKIELEAVSGLKGYLRLKLGADRIKTVGEGGRGGGES